DAGILAVGAPKFTTAGQTYSGSVFVYQWDSTVGIQGEYVLLAQVPPPTPEINGGFGSSVGVWDDMIVIGDNQMNIYQYQVVGFVVTPILIPQPAVNANSALGRDGISIWDQYVVAGDENFVPDNPAARGVSFVWDRDPITPTFYRSMYELV